MEVGSFYVARPTIKSRGGAENLALSLWRDGVKFVIVGKDQKLSIGIFNEGGGLEGAFCTFEDCGVTGLFPILKIKSPNVAVNKVPVNIFTLKFRNGFAAIMNPSGDGESATTIIFMDGIDEFSSFGWSIATRTSRMGSFSVGPSVVSSVGDNIDFFPSVLADVGSPELIGLWVKG